MGEKAEGKSGRCRPEGTALPENPRADGEIGGLRTQEHSQEWLCHNPKTHTQNRRVGHPERGIPRFEDSARNDGNF
jgi:hypothetical protein